jgi:hypothetical protein
MPSCAARNAGVLFLLFLSVLALGWYSGLDPAASRSAARPALVLVTVSSQTITPAQKPPVEGGRGGKERKESRYAKTKNDSPTHPPPPGRGGGGCGLGGRPRLHCPHHPPATPTPHTPPHSPPRARAPW